MRSPPRAATPAFILPRPLVLVGLMGAGKSAVGRRAASMLDVPFLDLDHEIERAAGLTVAEIFARYGERAFREAEQRALTQALEPPVKVIATGGGAFVGLENRSRIQSRALSVFLEAPLDVLAQRTERSAASGRRPLLAGGDVRGRLERLMQERTPLYREADLTLLSDTRSADVTAGRLLAAVRAYLEGVA